MDDCFDFIDEPLYGFRTLLTTQKFCFENDTECFQTQSIRFQDRQTQDFFSEAQPDCRRTLTNNNALCSLQAMTH